jgi:hypothetical protein
MGYQLWTSPVTGYRRRGTRLTDFNASLGGAVTVHALFEPLQCCPSAAPAEAMLAELSVRDFDVAGIKDNREGPVLGFVRRESLRSGSVVDHLERIKEDFVIEQSLPIEALLERLRQNSFFFVLVDGQLGGILTRADLNKPLARVYLFGLLSLLEIHMSFWVAQKYRDNAWMKILSEGRINRAKESQAEREKRGQVLALVDCLQFADRRDLVVSCNELRERLELGSKTKATAWLGEAESLRNTLAHSQYDLVIGSSWADLIDLVQTIKRTISISDAAVEQRATEMAQGFIGALW